MSTVLELKNVTVQFSSPAAKDKPPVASAVLRDISLQVKAGERVGLIGPSGQGKTVLLKVMAGLIRPTEGQLFIRGHDFHQSSETTQQELLLEMGMLFQKNALFDSMRNIENIRFPLIERKWSAEKATTTALQFLESVGIAHAAELFPDEISGGMQKRLGIARALALDPEILFYDDPTAGLDPITSRKIVELIVDLQEKKGSTIIAVTNDMNRAFQLARRIIMVTQQGIIETGTPDQTRNSADPRVRQFVTGQAQGPLTEKAAL